MTSVVKSLVFNSSEYFVPFSWPMMRFPRMRAVSRKLSFLKSASIPPNCCSFFIPITLSALHLFQTRLSTSISYQIGIGVWYDLQSCLWPTKNLYKKLIWFPWIRFVLPNRKFVFVKGWGGKIQQIRIHPFCQIEVSKFEAIHPSCILYSTSFPFSLQSKSRRSKPLSLSLPLELHQSWSCIKFANNWRSK